MPSPGYDSNANHRIVASGTSRYDGFQSDRHAHREQPTKVLRHHVARRPGGYEIRQRLALPSLPSVVSIRAYQSVYSTLGAE